MPAPIATVLLVLGAVLTSVSPLAGCCVAGLGALWQIVVSVAQAAVGTPKPVDELQPL